MFSFILKIHNILLDITKLKKDSYFLSNFIELCRNFLKIFTELLDSEIRKGERMELSFQQHGRRAQPYWTHYAFIFRREFNSKPGFCEYPCRWRIFISTNVSLLDKFFAQYLSDGKSIQFQEFSGMLRTCTATRVPLYWTWLLE